jgi:hypothetical protein
MDNERLVKKWHKSILAECVKRLARQLTEKEERFVTSRSGFMALEMIEDSVRSLSGVELETYLNQE